VRRGRVLVLVDGEEVDVALGCELARTQQTSVAVGDRVELAEWGDSLRAVAVAPRSSSLARPDPGNAGRERVLAANVDLAVVVLSVVSPPLRPALIDRFLVALEYGGVAPALCVNKADLLDSEERKRVRTVLDPYRALEIPSLVVSAEQGEGLDELRALLEGRTCVFAGHSGVGKSSLLNALDPGRARATGRVREGDGKGRHTTTASALHELGGGTRVIDTPGIRSFGLWRLDADGLRRSFREFERHAPDCRFRDCTHVHEPGCAVIAASESGAIAPTRYAAYRRLLDEV
jgi:ribosome biogenesis GTPase